MAPAKGGPAKGTVGEAFLAFGRNVITDGFCRWGWPEPKVSEEDVLALVRDHLSAHADYYSAALRSQPQEPERLLADEILSELQRARKKFPGDNVTTLALVEEVGELAKATFEESRERVRKEAVQVACMAMRVVLDGDSTLESWRERKGLDRLPRDLTPDDYDEAGRAMLGGLDIDPRAVVAPEPTGEKKPYYANPMTHEEAGLLRKAGLDPDNVMISEAEFRQGRWISADDLFRQLRQEFAAPSADKEGEE